MSSRVIQALIFFVILACLFLDQSASALAAERTGQIYDQLQKPDATEQNQQEARVKIGILFPKDGILSAYDTSLQTAIDAVRKQVAEIDSLPQVEFIEAELISSESQNNAEIERLIQEGVSAIVAPNFLSALITASSDELEILPLVSKANKTHELAFTGESSLYSNLSEHSVIIRTIQKLKFRSRLEEVVVLYDPTDAFGRFGYDVVVDVLSKEKASFSTEIFSADNVDFLVKLAELKEESPKATVIIIGKTNDVADVLIQAQDEIGHTRSVLGFIGDGNPAVYDLADREGVSQISGAAWDIVPQKELSDLVVKQFNNDRFAAEVYIAVWTILRSINEEYPPTREGIHNAFVEHEGHNLEEPSAQLVAWFYRTTRDSINLMIRNLNSL